MNVAVPVKPVDGVKVTTPPVSPTVPLLTLPTSVMVSASPSTSVSLPTRVAVVKVTGVLRTPSPTSSTATGGSLTGVTVIDTVAVALSEPSLAVTTTASAPW